MVDKEVLEGPGSRISLALYVAFYLVSGGFIFNEYFILGAEVMKTGPTVFVFLILWVVGVVLSFGLLIPISRKQRIKFGNILRIFFVVSVVVLMFYIQLRV